MFVLMIKHTHIQTSIPLMIIVLKIYPNSLVWINFLCYFGEILFLILDKVIVIFIYFHSLRNQQIFECQKCHTEFHWFSNNFPYQLIKSYLIGQSNCWKLFNVTNKECRPKCYRYCFYAFIYENGYYCRSNGLCCHWIENCDTNWSWKWSECFVKRMLNHILCLVSVTMLNSDCFENIPIW